MNITQDLDLLNLILHASLVVKLVLLILVLASLVSWWYIFLKLFSIRRATKQAEGFEHDFWGGTDLTGIYQRASSGRYAVSYTHLTLPTIYSV